MFFISNPGNGKLALLKLLNLLENTTYSLTDVEFSLPEINVEASPIRNTKVTAHFLGTKGFYGKKLIVYNRIHADDLPVLTVLRGLATTYYELIPVLNSTYNLRLSMSDIVDGPLPDIISEEIVVTLPFSPNSYLYYSTPEVVTVGSPPAYSLDKPSDVFNKYICVGLDQYKEYHMLNGDRYQTLHQANSYVCGYEDGSVRIQVSVPLEMDFYIGDPSGIFTIELKNGVADVTATLVLPSGLTASQTVFPLTVAQPSATFTVSSAQAGNYQLTFTNAGGVINPSPIDVIAKQLTAAAFTIISPTNTTVHPNQPSGAYTIVASDLDEPITITVAVTAGATLSETVFILTPLDNQATFTLQSPTEASYTLSFTNDLGILNPSDVVVAVTSAVVITFTAPPTPYNPDVQTGFFNVTMSQSSVPVTITPETTGGGIIDPTSLNLTPAAPTAGFKITYNTAGDKTVSLTNSVGGANPAPKQITVVEPYVTITAPVTTIIAGTISDAFTMTLVDSAANKTIDINTDAGTVYNSSNVEDYSYLLTPAQPTATFKLEYTGSFFGPGYVQGISYGQLSVDPTANFNVDNTATINIVVPASINTNEPYLMLMTRTTSVGEWTYDFHTVGSVLYLGADINNRITFIDGELTKNVYFVNTGNTNEIAYGAGIILELGKLVTGHLRTAVDAPGSPNITLSSLVTPSIETNVESELITVTANLLNTEINVYPYAETGITFSQNEITLTPASPSATFTVTATIAGNYLIGVETNVDPYIALPTELALEVTQGVVFPAYTVTYSETEPAMPGMFSAPYIVSLVNPEDTINVGIQLPPELYVYNNYLNLSPSNPTVSFTVSGNTIGNYSIGFIGSGGVVNPPNINHEIAITPSIYITGYYNQFTDWNDIPYDLVTNNKTSVYQIYDRIYDSSGGASEMPLTYPITLNFTLPAGVSMEWDYGDPIVGPLVLGSSDDVFGFRFVFTTEGSKHIVIENDQSLPWLYGISNTNITEQIKSGTIELDFHLGPLGTILLDEPVVALELNQESGVYSISAPDWNSIVDITISTSLAATVTIDAGHLVSGNVLRLSNSADVATFTITPLAQGYLAIGFTNDKQLSNPAISYNDIYSGVKPSLSIVAPTFNNFYTGEYTGDYTLVLNNAVADVLVTAVDVQSLGVYFDGYNSFKVLTTAQPQAIFKLNYGDVGTGIQLVFGNDSNLNTPSLTFDANYDQAEIAIVGTPTLSVERDSWSEYITVIATNLDRDYTCTIRIVGVSTGLAYDNDNFVLTPAQPSAQFRVLSSRAGNRTINIDAVPTNYPDSQRVISLVSNLVFSFSLPAGAAPYSVIEPADTETMLEFQSKTYTVQLEDPSQSFTVTIAIDGVTSGIVSPASFLLNSTNLTKTFTVKSSSVGVANISFTNNGGFDNPAPLTHNFINTPSVYIDGVYDPNLNGTGLAYNTTNRNSTPFFTVYDYYEYLTQATDYPFPLTFTVDLPLGCVAYDGNSGKEFTEKIYTNTVYDYFNFKFYVPGTNVITLSLDKSIPWQSGIGSISDNEVLTPDLVLTYNVTGDPAPFIYVTPVNGTTVQEDSAPATFTVNMLAPAVETIITINSWAGSGINTTTVVLSPSTPSADFTIAPSNTGNFTLSFSNNSGIRNPPSIPIVVIPASALLLTRNQTDTVGREEEETFTVTLTNPFNDVTVTPSVHANVTVGGYTPPLILNSTTPTGTFTVKSNVPAVYDIGITNNASIPNPAAVQMEVVSGSLSLTSAGGNYHETNADSLDFTVTLADYDFPTIVTIDITNFVDGTLTINPTVSYSANQMLLDSTNRTGTFKIKKPVDSQVSITITNNTSLTNPATQVHNFVAFSGGSLFIQEEDMSLNMSAPADASTDLNIFQTIV